MSLEMLQQNAKTFLEAAYEYERRSAAKDKKSMGQLADYMNALVVSMKKSAEEERAKWTQQK